MPLSKYDIELDPAHRAGTSQGFLLELVGSNKRVLDVGCDTGYLGEALAAYGNVTSGFEINEATAEVARTRLNRVEVGDLETIDLVALFGRESFDVVVFGDVLEHLRDPLRVLRLARPLLAPGGSVVISTPNIAHGDIRLALLQGKFNYTKVGILDETHTHFFTKDSLVAFLLDAGFVLADLRRTHVDLFQSEANVVESDFDPALVAALRRDVEATTYQFVLRAIPDDATQISSGLALRIDELSTELANSQAAVAQALAERDAALAAAAESAARLDELTERLRREQSWTARDFPGRHALGTLRRALRS